jgi:[ribosomal protein S18]-alanine N-acetyltransferase
MILADLDEVMNIEPVAYGSHHWSRQAFLDELNKPQAHYFVACDKNTGNILGYTGFWLVGEEAHITTLAVDADVRRHHHGERLLVHIVHQAIKLGASWITLEVRVSNEAAQKLYFKYGFKSLGVRRRYYQDNSEDAFVLWTDNIRSSQYQSLISERVEKIEELGQNMVDDHSCNRQDGQQGKAQMEV